MTLVVFELERWIVLQTGSLHVTYSRVKSGGCLVMFLVLMFVAFSVCKFRNSTDTIFWIAFGVFTCCMVTLQLIVFCMYRKQKIESIVTKEFMQAENNILQYRLEMTEDISQQAWLSFVSSFFYLIWTIEQVIYFVKWKNDSNPFRNEYMIAGSPIDDWIFLVLDSFGFVLIPLYIWISMPFFPRHEYEQCCCGICFIGHKWCNKCCYNSVQMEIEETKTKLLNQPTNNYNTDIPTGC